MSLVQDPSGAPAANTVDAVTPVFTGKNALAVAVASIGLPTGAATAANQATEITSLQILDDVPAAMNGPFVKASPVAGQLDDAATTAATEDNVAPVRITPQRALHSNLRNQAGTEVGVAAAPLRVDPTGTTAQPVTDNAGSLTIDTTQLPAALVGGRLDENVGAWLGSTTPTVGQKAMAASLPVALASDQSAVPVSAASLPLPTGAATEASLAAQSMVDNAAFTDGTTRIQPTGFIFDEVGGTALTENDGAAARIDSKRAVINVIEDATTRGTRAKVLAASTAAVAADPALVVAVSPNNTVPVQGAKSNNAVAPGATNIGTLPVLANAANPTWVEGNQVALSARLDGHLRVREIRSATGTSANVAGSATNVTLLASNVNRLGATIYNDNTTNLFLKLGATASLTSFTARLIPNAYYEVPANYTGIIDGIWSAAGAGAARVTELT